MKTKDTVLKMFCRTERHKRAESGEKGYIPYHLFFGMSLAVVLLFAGIGIVGATADYYVATWGCDDNKGTSVDEPWQHPSYAAQQAQAGDTIYLIDGTWYDEHVVFANSGNATHHITMTAYNGTPTFDGVDNSGYAIRTEYGGESFIDITGNMLIKNYGDAIYISADSSHINIAGLTITSITGWGVYMRTCNDIIIDNTTITDTGTAGAIITHLAGLGDTPIFQNITIKNCVMDDNNHDAINIFGNNKNVLIENNSITHATNGAGIMVHNFGNENITIRNNTIEDSTRGIWLIGVDGCLVEDNTILNSYSSHGILLYTFDESRSVIRNVTVRNNIVKSSSSHGIRVATYDAGIAASDMLFENNSIENVFSFAGPNISNITIKNIPDSERTVVINNAVSELQIEFTDSMTFKLNEDAGGHTSATLTGVGTYIIEVEGTAPDTTTPTTNATIIPAPDETGWNNITPVVMTFFRSDSCGSGISYTNYSKTSETGPWTTVTIGTATGPDAENVTAISESGFNVTVSDAGITQIWYYSVDSDSNVEHVKDVTVKIDTTATGIISGIVTNTTNNAPIQGATVTVEGTLKSAETDANGVYTLTDVPINTYTVTCTASGYQDSYQSDIKVNESETTQVIFALISSTITPLGDLAGEWRFEEGTGEAAVDTSGNENNGIIHGSANMAVGKIGSALKFDGLDDYVSIPNSPALNPADEITLIAWVNPGVIPQEGYRKIIAKPYTNSSYPWQQYALTLHDNQFVFELNTEGAKDTIASTETLEPDTWYHVTGTYDGLEMRIYVNAALNGTMPKSGAIAAYPTNVHIGAGIYSDAETEYINGTIDEVKIYNRALSVDEIQADYEVVSPVGLWRFDKGAGGVAVDSSGNENNGIIHGSANWTAGKLDSALEFDGLDDYVRIPNSPTLNPAEEITLLAWVNPGVIPQEGYRKIIAKPYTNYTTPWQQYALTLHDNQFVFELNTEGTKDAIASTETLEPNTWYHVTGTYDGSEMRIYVNAALNGTIQKSGAIAAYPTDMHIGAGIYTDAETEYITGTLDEVKIYNRALSADEIQADYEVGLSDTSGTISGTVTTLDSVGIANAAVTLTTLEGAEIVTTQTDINGNYTFEDIAPGVYNLSVSKLRFWPTTITVNTGDALSEDIMLWLKGDLNLNGESGDSDDLIMMDYAATGGLIPDWKFDLNTNGEFACAGDVLMLEEAAAGKIELL